MNILDKAKRYAQQGIIFGTADAVTHERIAVLVFGPESLGATLFMSAFDGERIIRMKPSQLVQLRDALNKAIDWFEERKAGEKQCTPS